MALVLTITDAGRAALVNASNTGTLPITLTTVVFGSGNYTPSQHQTELQAPFKNLQTFSGDVVAADQIHLTVRDESEDQYTLNELGLLTETGVLFAVYSHPTTSILEKAAAGVVLLSVDATVTGDIAQNITFGDTNFLLPAATETTAGVIAKATSSEALARLSHTKTLTPKTGGELLAAHETATEAHTWLQIANKPAQATRWPAWTEITSKPTVYPAASHLHAWGELTGLPAYATRWPSWSEVTNKPASFTASSHTHSWSSITEKPATFTATAHSHPWADLTGVPTQATRWPVWGEVTSKPTSFVPSAHSHPWADLTGVPTQATRWPAWGEVTDKPTAFTPISHTHAWSAITGAPAQATRWPSWSEVTSKPTSFTPSTHSHSSSQITGLDAALNAKMSGFTLVDGDDLRFYVNNDHYVHLVEGGGIDIAYQAGGDGSEHAPKLMRFMVTSAPKLSNNQVVDFLGDATGTLTFNGSARASVYLTVSSSGHGHEMSGINGLTGALSNKLDKTAQAADSAALAGKGLRYSGGNWNKVAHIDSSGNLEGARGISFYGATNKTESDWRIYYAATGDNSSLYFYNDGNSVRHIFTDEGDFYADGEVRAGYSDERLKNNEGELTNALAALCQWKIFKYTPNATAQQWLNNKKPPQVDIGISAQSVEQHFPELVVPAPFDIGEAGESITGEHYKTLRYERTVAVVAAALQQLAKHCEQQEQRIAKLENVLATKTRRRKTP